MNEATQRITQHVHATPQIFVCIFKMLYDAVSTQAPHVIPDAVHLPQWAVATEQSASSGFKRKAGGCFPTRTLHFEGKQGEHFVLDQFGSTFPNAQVVMATGCKRKIKVGVRSQTVEPSHNEPHHAAFNDMLSKTTRTTKNQTSRVTQQGSSISSMLH